MSPEAETVREWVRVFISYAHDSAEHEETVRSFYRFLRTCGIDAQVDLPAAERRQDWAEWMTRQIRDADRILVVASPEYRRRAEGDAGSEEGRGVQWEARQIRDRIYADQRAGLQIVLPVVLPGGSVTDLPAWLAPNSTTHYVIEEFTVTGANRLLRVLTSQPWETEPPLGAVPELPPRSEEGTHAPRGGEALFAVSSLSGQEVPRPDLMAALINKVTARGAGTVGMTTGLRGVGGFGKTTLARMLVHEPRVREAFNDGIVWVTVGEGLAGPDLAARINELVEVISGKKPSLTDPTLAGSALAATVGNRRMLLVIDDVWSRSQLDPFQVGGPNTVRLITTRQHDVLPATGVHVDVDAMDEDEARHLLLAGLNDPPQDAVAGLLKATGHSPQLLALVNGAARTDVARGAATDKVLRELLDDLTTSGPTVLDVHDANDRSRAVAATLEVSLTRLTPTDRDRFNELAIFPEDVDIPLSVLGRYWAHTGGLGARGTRRLCDTLAGLSLLAEYQLDDPARLRLHDVIRSYLRNLTRDGLGELNRALLDAHRGLAPATDSTATAWWELPAAERHLWTWLPTHMWGAGLTKELEMTVQHPRWLVGKLQHVGPAGLEADLALTASPTSVVLQRVIRQNAQLLAPLNPSGALAATLLTRIPDDPALGALRGQLNDTLPARCLRAVSPLPDLPHPALHRTLTGHTGSVAAVAVAPDGTWLATGSWDKTVRIWDPVTGTQRHTLTGHTGPVAAVGIAPDGSWLVTGGREGTVRIWDPVTGTQRHTLTGHRSFVDAVAVAPDGTWLATGSWDKTARIWDPVSGTQRHTLTSHTDSVTAVAIAPDGTWLATGSRDGTTRIWDTATGVERHALTGHTGPVAAVAIAPDGTWLATGSHDGTARIWDPATSVERHTLTGHTDSVIAVAIAPDGTWLATGSWDGTARIWDPATGVERHTLAGHIGPMVAVAIAPDGTWLATGSIDGTVRIWDPATGVERHTLTGHTAGVKAVAIAPDGTWLATGSIDRMVRIWDPATGVTRHTLTGHTSSVNAVAITPEGTWLATGGDDRTVRIWDPATGTEQRTLTGHTGGVIAVAIAPAGTWLATCSHDATARIWDPATGTLRHTLTGHTGHVAAVSIALDGTWLATCSRDGTARVWDPVSGAVRHILTGHTGGVYAVAVAPDGTWLTTGSDDRTARIWNPTTGTERHTLTGHTRGVIAVAIAPDGTWLATGSWDGTARIWDPTTGTERHTLTGHTSAVNAVAIAPDGTWLATGSWDETVRIWDPTTGTQRHTLTGHTSAVNAVAVAPDGTWLATSTNDATVRIWDPATGTAVTALRVAGNVQALAAVDSLLVMAGAFGPYFLRTNASPAGASER
jgi:WD40 repeat protein